MSNVLNARIPAMRVSELVMTETGDDTLVYDAVSHSLHALNRVTVEIWQASDGQQTLGSLIRKTRHDESAVRRALTLLADASLLDDALPAEVRITQSRRNFMKKAAIAGGAAIPVIVSTTAPSAAQGASVCPSPCEATVNDYWCPNRSTCGTCVFDEWIDGVGGPYIGHCVVPGE